MFKTIYNSGNIFPTEIILVSKKQENIGNIEKKGEYRKIMFGCGPKYFSEGLKLERVYKHYLLSLV